MRRLLPSSNPLSLLLLLSRRFASAPSSAPPKLKNLCYRHRSRALLEARRALTDYLHSTRGLPFSLADQIASNSPFSLSSLVSQVPFADSTPSQFPRTLRRFLSYRPINEFDFFFESIGLPPSLPSPSPSPSPFLSDAPLLLTSLSSLLHFGFPWTRLGLLYREEPAIFCQKPEDLDRRLHAFEELGFRRVCVIGICLAFPSILIEDFDPGGEVHLLFRDLKTVFVDFELERCAGENLDAFFEICRRIRVFYDLGSERGKMGELMGKNKRFLLELESEVLAQRLIFFLKLGMRKEDVGLFVLQCSEIFYSDLESMGITMPEYLISIGLDEKEAAQLCKKYPYVMGKNKFQNLPGIMRAMNLHGWFLDKIVSGNHCYLSPAYASVNSDSKKMEDEFLEELERVKSLKKHHCVDYKLEFLFSIGFGENKITAKAVGVVNSTQEQLQERFGCLLELGIEYPMLCRMISATPKLLNQSTESLRDKVNFLCHDLNYSLEYLDVFPAFLCFDLENRTKPRYRIINWLKENGLPVKFFAPATVLANSEKRFMINLQSIHPAAPKQWLESFSCKGPHNGHHKILFPTRP